MVSFYIPKNIMKMNLHLAVKLLRLLQKKKNPDKADFLSLAEVRFRVDIALINCVLYSID